MWLRKVVCIPIIMTILLSSLSISIGQEDESQIILRCATEKIQNTNPLKEGGGSWKILGLVYEGATKYDPNTGLLIPYIAMGSANKSHKATNITWVDRAVGNFGYSPRDVWDDSGKPEIIIFYDFENVYWHDGVQMSIRDVMFSFHAHATFQYPWLGHPLSDETNYSRTQWLDISIIWEAEDHSKAALKFVLQKPQYSIFEYYLSLPVLPYHIWGSMAGGQDIDGALIWYDANYSFLNRTSWQPSKAYSWTNPKPIGSGPFMWGEMESDRLTLTTWREHFYRPGYKYEAQAAQPNIDEISFRHYEHKEKAIMDLENDELDYISWTMPQSDINRFANEPDINIKYLKAASIVEIIYNLRGKSFGYNDTDQFSVKDLGKPLRKALAHCIDTTKIDAMTRFAPEGEKLGLYDEWKNTSAPRYAFDPNEAINILERAGYLMENPSLPPGRENNWLNPDGSSMGTGIDGTIELLIAGREYDPLMFQIGSMVADQIADIGIDIELIPLDINELWNRIFNGEFQMSIAAQNYPSHTLVKFELGEDEDMGPYRNPPRIWSPDPQGGAMDVTPYGPRLNVFISDPDGDPVTVTFYNAWDNNVIGIDQVEFYEGETASVRWHNLHGSITYSWYVIADDGDFRIRSPTWSFTTSASIGTRGTLTGTIDAEGIPQIYRQRPENYYYSHFHSESVYDGPNFSGYRNSSFDQLIERAMSPVNRELEEQYVQDAIATLDYDVPVNFLYYQYRYEVHRSDKFAGFIDDGSSSLLNLRSMTSVREREKNLLSVDFLNIPSSVISNSTSMVKIGVLDQDGEIVQDASILLESSAGNFALGGNMTNEQGVLITNFTAPYVPSETWAMNGTQVRVSIISVSKEGYQDALSIESFITIYPENVIPLSVEAIATMDVMEDMTSDDMAGYTYIDVLVTDPDQLPINEAIITIELDGAQMIPNTSTGMTDAQGSLRLKLTAMEVNETKECAITITASKRGFMDDQQQVFLTILPTNLEAGDIQIHDNGWTTTAAIISVVAVVGIAYAWWKKGRKKVGYT